MKLETILGQGSWVLENDCVRMAVTELGGHMAPVRFLCGNGVTADPYHISPWQGETHGMAEGRSETPLRGDFFCLPFGGGPPLADDETHTPHGQTAGERWTFVDTERDGKVSRLRIAMDLSARPGRVERSFFLVNGHNAVYDRTVIRGFAGPVTLGHHAVLALPAKEGALLVAASPFKIGMTYPHPFANPASGEYQSLAVNARFADLREVPSIFAGAPAADCSSYPRRKGFTDLLQISAESDAPGPAWTTAVNTESRTLWFAIRDRAILPSTVFWIENSGRHQPPWSGRNCSLGLEDVCSYFDCGIRAAYDTNPFSEAGVHTFHDLSHDAPFTVNYVQGAVAVPSGFGRVRDVIFSETSLTFMDKAGREVSTPVSVGFVFGEDL